MIRKEYRIYRLENGLRLECSRVDPGTDTEFYYAEVEFQDQQQAEIFFPPPDFFLGKEVTYDGSYRMKAYYQRKNRGAQCGVCNCNQRWEKRERTAECGSRYGTTAKEGIDLKKR